MQVPMWMKKLQGFEELQPLLPIPHAGLTKVDVMDISNRNGANGRRGWWLSGILMTTGWCSLQISPHAKSQNIEVDTMIIHMALKTPLAEVERTLPSYLQHKGMFSLHNLKQSQIYDIWSLLVCIVWPIEIWPQCMEATLPESVDRGVKTLKVKVKDFLNGLLDDLWCWNFFPGYREQGVDSFTCMKTNNH
ncbi:hypothetical protein BS47DRAFT_1365541 [Hydnum rufescens UP504]|uniref:Uncharacterized protein n=1 Tax=Hydnum rufescens UP504 TaxID=1448309 RepID=A0A9P6DRZ9_9AGAM|nr:hypothetical protein BS47DRAFT_1365541 [Hydnum rufescens UP504]